MYLYWIMFLFPATLALIKNKDKRQNFFFWFFFGVCFTLIIGLRHQVGSDWGAYLRHYETIKNISDFEKINILDDPAHFAINWLMAKLHFGFYGVNVLYALIFLVGLIKISREQPYPWLAITVAFPYLILVVSMSLTKQSAALGIFLFSISYLKKEKIKTYFFLIFLATLFHKSAIILLGLGLISRKRNKLTYKIFLIIILTYVAWVLTISQNLNEIKEVYLKGFLQSPGTLFRLSMNLIPSLILLFFYKEWKKNFDDFRLYLWIAIVSILLMIIGTTSSTAIDRIAIYFIVIQLIVYSRLPIILQKNLSPIVTKFFIILVYSFSLSIWLHFGKHSYSWIPYKNILFLP